MATPLDPSNPYLSPEPSHFGQRFPGATTQAAAPRLPVYCLVMFIIDLGFSLLRAPLVLFSLAVIMSLLMGANAVIPDADVHAMAMRTGLFEVITGAGIVLFGVPGNIALLCKQRWALVLAWLAVVATVGSIGVGIWQLTFMVQQFPDGSPERVGAVIGGLFTGGFRVALLALYAGALVIFVQWSNPGNHAETWQDSARR